MTDRSLQNRKLLYRKIYLTSKREGGFKNQLVTIHKGFPIQKSLPYRKSLQDRKITIQKSLLNFKTRGDL